MSTDDPMPEAPTVESVLEDLSLSNEEGSGWFRYEPTDDESGILVQLFDDNGDIAKTFTIELTIKEN